MTANPSVLSDLAPQGFVRAAINFGNSVLAQRDAATGEARGVAVSLAKELGRRLGVPVEMVTFEAAGKLVEALQDEAWDVAFLAIDPHRSREIAFTAPYLLIEGAYMVRADSALIAPADVDQAGVRVAAGKGAAYELFLSRQLKHARVERSPSAIEAFQQLAEERVEAAAGVRQIVERHAQANGFRVLRPSFMTIEQALGTPAGREAGSLYLQSFIEELKSNGFVAEALAGSGQGDALVAPSRAH